MKKMMIGIAAVVIVCAALGAAFAMKEKANDTESREARQAEDTAGYDGTAVEDQIAEAQHAVGDLHAGVSVHDPSIIRAGDTYYIFGTHMESAFSTDLRTWTRLGNGYSPDNPVYGNLFAPESGVFAYAGSKNSLIPTDDGGYHVWAPDAVYNETTGLYYLYYCTSSTWNASNLCYGVSESVTGPYEWQDALIYSGFTGDTLAATDVTDYVSEEYALQNYTTGGGREYNFRTCPNALDPSVFFDAEGRWWMVYGSWSGGIFLLELDKETGRVIHPAPDPENDVDPYFGKRLLGGGHKSIEGPYILYDADSGYYYLFVSYGSLVRTGGYQIRVFRSENVDGPYEDMQGQRPLTGMNHADYGLKLSGNYFLPGLKQAYMATGHNSAFTDTDGKHYLVYHTRFDGGTEYHEPRVKQFFINEEGWPCLAPYATAGETISETGYSREETAGSYYVVAQGKKISSDIAQPFNLVLAEDGTVSGEGIEGHFEVSDGTCYVHFELDGARYSGVFCRTENEAGEPVMIFSAVGDNESIWGVKFLTV